MKSNARRWLVGWVLCGLGAFLIATWRSANETQPAPPKIERRASPEALAAATVTGTTGRAVAESAAERRPLTVGDTVYLGESVQTEGDASVALSTSVGDVKLSLSGDTSLVLVDRGEISLTRGRLAMDVPDIIVAVTTPAGRVVGRQSGFTLAVHGGNADVDVDVDVTKGEALVLRADGTNQKVAAGQNLSFKATGNASGTAPGSAAPASP